MFGTLYRTACTLVRYQGCSRPNRSVTPSPQPLDGLSKKFATHNQHATRPRMVPLRARRHDTLTQQCAVLFILSVLVGGLFPVGQEETVEHVSADLDRT